MAGFNLPSYAKDPSVEEELPLQPNEPDTSLTPDPPVESDEGPAFSLPAYAPPAPDTKPAEATVLSRETEGQNKDHEALAKDMAPKLGHPFETVRNVPAKELQTLDMEEALGNLHPSARQVVDAMAINPYANVQFTDSFKEMETLLRGMSQPTKEQKERDDIKRFNELTGFNRNVTLPLTAGTAQLASAFNLSQVDAGIKRISNFDKIDALEGDLQKQFRVVFGVPEGAKFVPTPYRPDSFLSQYQKATPEKRIQIREALERSIGVDQADLQNWVKLQQALPKDVAFEKFIHEDDPLGLLGHVMENPATIWRLMVQTAPNMAVTMAARVASGPLGGGLASLAVEQSAAMVELLQQEKIDLTDPVALRALMEDQERMQEFRSRAFAKGVGIAVFDTFGMLLAGVKLAGPKGILKLAQRAEKGVPQGAPGRLSKWAGNSANHIFQMGVQGSTEFGGEMLGQGLAGMDLNWTEGLVEGIAGSGMSVIDVAAANGQKAVWKYSDLKDQKAYSAAATEFLKTGKKAALDVKQVPAAQRDMPLVAEVMAKNMEEDGVEAIFIDAENLDALNQDSEFDLIETLGLDQDAVTEAAENGGHVEISAAQFARHILGVDGFDALIEHSKREEEGMTPAEAKEFESKARAEIEAEIERTSAEILETNGITEEDAAVISEDFELIQSDIYSQLRAQGVSEQEAGLQSLLTAQRAVTRSLAASRASGQKVSPLELYSQDNLVVVGSPNPTAPLNQVDPLANTVNTAWRDAQVTGINAEGVEETVPAGEAFDAIQGMRVTGRRLLDCIRAG